MSLPELEEHETVTSTNDLALQAVRDGAPHGTCIVASMQTQGRGRRSRSGERRQWHSPKAVNVYASVLLRPHIEPARAAHLTLGVACAVRRVIAAQDADLDPWIKWPNDIYLGELKVAGVLTEGVSSGMELEAIVVGVGINVNLRREDVPKELAKVMTSMRMHTGHMYDPGVIATQLRDAIVSISDEIASHGLWVILEDLRMHERTTGRSVAVMDRGLWVHGVATGISDAGELCVQICDVDGAARELRVLAGEARFV